MLYSLTSGRFGIDGICNPYCTCFSPVSPLLLVLDVLLLFDLWPVFDFRSPSLEPIFFHPDSSPGEAESKPSDVGGVIGGVKGSVLLIGLSVLESSVSSGCPVSALELLACCEFRDRLRASVRCERCEICEICLEKLVEWLENDEVLGEDSRPEFPPGDNDRDSLSDEKSDSDENGLLSEFDG